MPHADPDTATPVVVRDVFPARAVVTEPDGPVLTSARVVITRDRVLVYVDRSGPALDEPYDAEASTVPRYNAPSAHPAHLRLLDGRLITVARQRGCACSSPLRGWRPWSPFRVAAS